MSSFWFHLKVYVPGTVLRSNLNQARNPYDNNSIDLTPIQPAMKARSKPEPKAASELQKALLGGTSAGLILNRTNTQHLTTANWKPSILQG
jgi:hypothetical protein